MLSDSRKNYLTGLARQWHQQLDERTACYLSARGVSRAAAVRHGLGTVGTADTDHHSYLGMLCIPYVTPTGVVGFKFRQLDPDGEGPKYTAPPGQRTRLFNAQSIVTRESQVIALCEGELDAIVAGDVLGVPAVGVPGVQNWKPHYRRLFDGYSRVLLLADNDEPKKSGKNPGQEFAEALMAKLDNAERVTLPPGQDVTDFVLAEGGAALRALCSL